MTVQLFRRGCFESKNSPTRILCLCFLLLILQPALCKGDDAADKGRLIISRYEQAVIKAKLVIQLKITLDNNQVQNTEKKLEATGMVIHPSGLTVISLSLAEPETYAEAKPQVQQYGSRMKIDSELKDVKLLFGNGSEVQATIVLRDRDLDLAFIQPKEKPDRPCTAVAFSADVSPALLDTIVVLGRFGKIAGRVPSVTLDRICTILDKPRRMYIPRITSELGAPAFTLDGDWIGVTLMRSTKERNVNPSFVFVVLPATDILEVAAQIPGMASLKPGAPK